MKNVEVIEGFRGIVMDVLFLQKHFQMKVHGKTGISIFKTVFET